MLDRPVHSLKGISLDEMGTSARRGAVLTAQVASAVTVVSLLGEHDISTADELRATLATLLQADAGVVLDLSETEFVECQIMHVLQDSLHQAPEHGGRISLQSPTRPIVKRVFDLIGTTEAWPLYATQVEAIRALGSWSGS